MPSETHQWLVVWLSRKMARDGYTPIYADAYDLAKYIPSNPKCSPILGSIRPDVIGFNNRTKRLAFAEAKTAGDILNRHTQMQLETLLQIRDRCGRFAEIYLGFPRSSWSEAAKLIFQLRLNERIKTLPIPDVIITHGKESESFD